MQQTPLKLLMVEDSSMDAELTLMRLERSGLHVQSQLVFDHVGVDHALREARYDLILCDCVLPGSEWQTFLKHHNLESSMSRRGKLP